MDVITIGSTWLLKRSGFDHFIDALRAGGYRIVGPTIVNGVIVLGDISTSADLPEGKSSASEPGKYRLEDRTDRALFGYSVGPSSVKSWLIPPKRTVWRAKVNGGQVAFEPNSSFSPKTAIIGLKPCDIRAIEALDKVFLAGKYQDSYYKSVREGLLLVVADCSNPASTCFCTSIGGRPAATSGFDIRLSELIDAGGNRFVLEAGSVKAVAILSGMEMERASAVDLERRELIESEATRNIAKQLDISGLKEALYRNVENAQWLSVSNRCFACGNCTAVCPTCFCTNVADVTTIGSPEICRERTWDSCFNEEFSYIFGGSVRQSTMSRYRQWMIHKLASWTDQFGTDGCVGCGRCIAWCPAGIDIAQVADTIRRTDTAATRPSARNGVPI